MVAYANDIVCVARGSWSQVEFWHELLEAAGIESRVVGDNLTAGLGTALPGSVELWVHSADAEAAEAAIVGAGDHHPSHAALPHGHPMSDPKRDHSRGVLHGAPLHRPLPSR